MSNYPNSVTLFPNDKRGNEKAPDFRGNGDFNGMNIKVAGWKRSIKGNDCLSLKVEPDNYKAEKKEDPQGSVDTNEEIPF